MSSARRPDAATGAALERARKLIVEGLTVDNACRAVGLNASVYRSYARAGHVGPRAYPDDRIPDLVADLVGGIRQRAAQQAAYRRMLEELGARILAGEAPYWGPSTPLQAAREAAA